MISLNSLNEEALRELGIEFFDSNDAEHFCNIVISEGEIRIGEKMSECVPEEELDNFEKIIDEENEKKEDRTEVIKEWLDKNCPQYNEIIHDVTLELENELKKYKDKIPWTKSYSIADKKSEDSYRNNKVDELELSIRAEVVLKKANIKTLGELEDATIKKLMGVRNNTPAIINEIIIELRKFYEENDIK